MNEEHQERQRQTEEAAWFTLRFGSCGLFPQQVPRLPGLFCEVRSRAETKPLSLPAVVCLCRHWYTSRVCLPFCTVASAGALRQQQPLSSEMGSSARSSPACEVRLRSARREFVTVPAVVCLCRHLAHPAVLPPHFCSRLSQSLCGNSSP